MFLECPGCLPHDHYFLFKPFIKARDKSTDEISFFLQASLSSEDEEVGEVLFEGMFALEEAFEFGQGSRRLVRIAICFIEAFLEFGIGVSGVTAVCRRMQKRIFFYLWLTTLTERSRVPWTCDTDPASHETRKH